MFNNVSVLILKKEKYVTKDNKTVYRVHFWIDNGVVQYTVCSVDEVIYELLDERSTAQINFELRVFNNEIQGIKNVSIA